MFSSCSMAYWLWHCKRLKSVGTGFDSSFSHNPNQKPMLIINCFFNYFYINQLQHLLYNHSLLCLGIHTTSAQQAARKTTETAVESEVQGESKLH